MAGGNDYLDNLRLGQDPVLTNLAMGYSNGIFIAEKVFPIVKVNDFPTLRVPEMNRDHLKIIDDYRALYGDAVESKNGGYTYQDISMREYTQQKRIDIQERIGETWGNLKKERTFALTESQLLRVEKDTADIIQTTGNYVNSNTATLAGTDQWTHASSDPIVLIWNALEVVRGNCGHRPNLMAMGPTSAWALQKNAAVVAAVLGPDAGGIVPLAKIAAYFGFTKGIHVGEGIYDNSEVITDTFDPVDLWSDNALFIYQPDRASKYIPAFGYTFAHKQFYPSVRMWAASDGLKDWVQSSRIWASKLYNDLCGYLMEDTNI